MKRQTRRELASIVGIATLSAAIATPAQSKASGIALLLEVARLKAANANEDALIGAERQRKLIAEQKALRASERSALNVELDAAIKNGKIIKDELANLARMIKQLPC